MNTDRDNFHDWARDKPDTAFGSMSQPARLRRGQDHQAVRWGRLVMAVLLGAVLVAGFKWFAGL
ncbi:hypothetical protein [Variovorax sp. KK3]|uniref:hypothetical protein n=1 Tax=Variovorax sp. KK3 TaxID=1855728 RepID=UPI003AAA31C7